jgi:L-lactate dehydrogenase complex protein LldG
VSSARAEILERIRATTGATTTLTPTPRDYRQADKRSRDELAALFCERVKDYKAEVEYVDLPDLPVAIGAAASRHGARRIVIPTQLPDEWRPPVLELIRDRSLTPRELDQLDGVITGCTIAIAETGTIAISAGPHEGRRLLTLVPDMHICVVHARQVVATVPEAIAQLAPIIREHGRPLTLISGPSATSDIELKRVEGVHGPRKLVVLVIRESA